MQYRYSNIYFEFVQSYSIFKVLVFRTLANDGFVLL